MIWYGKTKGINIDQNPININYYLYTKYRIVAI